MTGLGEYAAGKSIGWGIKLMTYGVRELLKRDALGRLLLMLHSEFGERTQLGRDVFDSWRARPDLEAALCAVLAGQAPEAAFKSSLTALISERLVRTDPPDRAALAAEIADAVFEAAPAAADGGNQALAMMLVRIEQGQGSLMEAIEKASLSGPPAPTDGGPADGPNLAQALVVGPVKAVGAVDAVADAERLAEGGDQLAAGRALIDVSRRLAERDLTYAAENLRERAAAHLAAGGAIDDAAAVLMEIALARIDRGASRSGAMLVHAVRDLLDPSEVWLADGIAARAGWAEQGEAAVEALSAAALAATSAGRDDSTYWVAAHVELLAVDERWPDVVEAAGAVADADPEEGPVLAVILDVFDAREAIDGADSTEKRWLGLLRWADAEAPPRAQAVVWQRRGTVLARREKVAQASDAFRRAMAAWAGIPGHEEQAADAFFCLQATAIINAKPIPDMELRALAWTVRGAAGTPVAVTDRLDRDAMARRLNKQLPDARVGYMEAYLINRRVGSLQGCLETSERLAELYQHAGELGEALTFFIRAGKGKEAAQVAAQMPGDAVAARLSVSGPRWERAAALHVIAECGRGLPSEFVALMTQSLLDEAAGEPDAMVAPQPVSAARRALATVFLSVPEEMRDEVFGRLVEYLTCGLFDLMHHSARALVLATRAGIVDARPQLVARFIEDPYNSSISWAWLAREAEKHESVRDALLAAARDGKDAMLEPLAAAGLIGNGELQDRVDAVTIATSQVVTVERTIDEETGKTNISAGFGFSFEGPAVVARGASAEPRAALVARMLEVLTSTEEPELNRSGAAGALFNIAPSLELQQAQEVAAAITPLALGEYERSQLDVEQNHPLSRVQISFGAPNQLRVSAIGTLAQLVSNHSELDVEPLREAVTGAVRTNVGSVVGAAFDAAARLPLVDFGIDPEDGFFHPDSAVRIHALVAWAARSEGLPADGLVERLATDADINVRLQLTAMAGHAGEAGAALLERLARGDADAFVRAKSVFWLRQGADHAAE